MPALHSSPLDLLRRWVAQLHYNSIRNVEIIYDGVRRTDDLKPLRGVLLAPDLCMTRKRAFYCIDGARAKPLSAEEVAARYSLGAMQMRYKFAVNAWKADKRRAG